MGPRVIKINGHINFPLSAVDTSDSSNNSTVTGIILAQYQLKVPSDSNLPQTKGGWWLHSQAKQWILYDPTSPTPCMGQGQGLLSGDGTYAITDAISSFICLKESR